MYEFSKIELDVLILFLDSVIVPDLKYSKTIQKSISQSKNKNISDKKVEEISLKRQNLRDSIYLVDKHINNFQGIICEKIEMFNYNYIKNKSDVITITNPESQSKADLIHIFDKGNYSFSSCGPDVKFGETGYIVDEYIKKHLARKDSSGFVDISGYLDPKDYKEGIGFKKLTKGQNKKILEAISKFGYKPATMPVISRIQYQQISAYYLQYISTGILPSKSNKKDFYSFYTKMINNEVRVCDLSNNLTIIQNEIKISEIKDLMETIRNPDYLIVEEKSVPDDVILEKDSRKKRKNSLRIEPKRINTKIIGGALFAITSIALIGHPKSRKCILGSIKKIKWNKKIKSITNKCVKKSVSIASTTKIIPNETVKKTTINLFEKTDVKEIVSKILCEIDADNVSVFSPVLKMFEKGIISREEFFDISSEIEKRTGKHLKSYLRLMVNFHKNASARTLLN